ncbi:CHAT domain-containing tetratricopeptide repeat protein [Streptomyces avermitilis]|uniref:CHAT domain-containing tetratricopeptide repeat protein n=1 Tax=Streptomyces avermitilis TaxID=33903 RepID=UPI0033CBF660
MTEPRDPEYQNLVRHLVERDSVEQIEERAGQYGTHPGRLRAAFEEAVAESAAQGREAERNLLLYVAGIADRVPTPPGAEDHGELSSAARAALAAARESDNPLTAYRLLAETGEEFTEPTWHLLKQSWLSSLSDASDHATLRLLHLIALVTRGPGPRVESLLLLARHHDYEGALGLAGRYHRRAVAIARSTRDPRLLFEACGPYATWLYNGDNFLAAIPLYEEALAGAELALTGPVEVLQTLRTRRGLASAYRLLGNHEGALDVVETALDLTTRVREFLDVADAMGLQIPTGMGEEELRMRQLHAELQDDLGELDLAEAEFSEVEADAERWNQRAVQFEVLGRLSWVAADRGDDASAERWSRDAAEMAKESGDPDRTAATHNNLGAFYLGAGRLDDALTTYGTAMRYAAEAGAPNRSATLAAVGLGDVARERGNDDMALAMYEKALEWVPPLDFVAILLVCNRLMQNDHWWTTRIAGVFESFVNQTPDQLPLAYLARIADAYAQRRAAEGRIGEATELLRHAIQLIHVRSPHALELLSLRLRLAQLLAEEPRSLPESHRLLTEVVRVQTARVSDALLGPRKSEVVADAVAAHGALVGLLVDHGSRLAEEPQPTAHAFALHEAAKARSLAAHLGRAAVHPPDTVPPQLLERERHLLELERSALAGGRGTTFLERRRRFQEIDAELRGCWAEMSRYAAPYVRLRSGEPATVPELTALLESLPQRTALASFFCDEKTTTCFVLRPDAPLTVTRLPVGRDHWARAGRTLRREFNGAPREWPPYPPIRRDRPGQRGLSVLDGLGRELAVLLAPVRDVDLLCVAPHGPLHVLPVHALRGEDGRYLVERHGVVYTPSLTTLLHSLAGRRARSTAPRSAFIAGVAAEDDSHPEFFEQDETVFDDVGVPVLVRNGPRQATREHVLAELAGHDVVHLTCHGFFDDRFPLRSGLLLGDGAQRPPRALNRVGVRRRRRFLTTAEDLLDSRVHAEIVTLRACSSGLVGERNAGDEFDGLTRSFIQAGAGAVLAGQWNVDQRSSHGLVSAFYRGWLGAPVTTAKWQALREAQLALMHSTDEPYLAHPYHWAALALLGDWR